MKKTLQKKEVEERAKGYKSGDLDRPAGERWCSLSNALVRAGQGLSLSEKRLVMLAVSRLDSMAYNHPGARPPSLKLAALDYAEAFGVDARTAYEALQAAARALFERKITFFEPAHKRGGKPLTPTRTDMRWVGRCSYDTGAGAVELAFWPEILPHLTGLKKQFTTYQLQQASALRSVYSWRLLELLARFKSTGVAEYTIEDFLTSMDAPPTARANFAASRRKIIEPAVKELREKDGWAIDWEPVKTGRRVTKLRFSFERDPQTRLDF